MVRAIMEDEDGAARLPFVGSKSMNDGVETVLRSIRETLELDVAQYRSRQITNRAPNGFG